MARQPTSHRNRPSRQPASSALAKKHPSRNTDTLLADIAAINDAAYETGAADKALAWCHIAARRKLDDTRRCLLDFHTANAFICRHRETQGNGSGTWEHPDIENAIAHLRKAIANPAFPLLDELPRCRILTLLGNQYGYMGHFTEALACWNRALAIDSRFGMALGNRGKSIAEYAELPAMAPQKTAFLKIACENLADATADNARYYGDEQGKHYFLAEHEKTEMTLLSDDAALPDVAPGKKNAKTGKDKPYRKWCAENTLCLNPYNDLGKGTAASGDLPEWTNTDAPGIVTPTARTLSHLYREYTAIRRLCHDAIHARALRGAGKKNAPGNPSSPPSPAAIQAIETVKLACRAGWALLPKIARLVNDHFGARLPDGKYTLKTVWYTGGNPAEGLAAPFAESTNWPLRGLFWLSKSLPPERHLNTLEPDSILWKTVATTLENGSLRIIEHDGATPNIVEGTLSRRQLQTCTLAIMRLARNALVYLTLAIAEGTPASSGKHTPDRNDTIAP